VALEAWTSRAPGFRVTLAGRGYRRPHHPSPRGAGSRRYAAIRPVRLDRQSAGRASCWRCTRTCVGQVNPQGRRRRPSDRPTTFHDARDACSAGRGLRHPFDQPATAWCEWNDARAARWPSPDRSHGQRDRPCRHRRAGRQPRPGHLRSTRRSRIWLAALANRSGCCRATTDAGAGCTKGPTAPGIPRCTSIGSSSHTIGQVSSQPCVTTWPRSLRRVVRHRRVGARHGGQSSRCTRSMRSWRSCASIERVAMGRASSRRRPIGSPVSSQKP
jgi:hypothetical protein